MNFRDSEFKASWNSSTINVFFLFFFLNSALDIKFFSQVWIADQLDLILFVDLQKNYNWIRSLDLDHDFSCCVTMAEPAIKKQRVTEIL